MKRSLELTVINSNIWHSWNKNELAFHQKLLQAKIDQFSKSHRYTKRKLDKDQYITSTRY